MYREALELNDEEDYKAFLALNILVNYCRLEDSEQVYSTELLLEEMRQGIQKLREVSHKEGYKLPQRFYDII